MYFIVQSFAVNVTTSIIPNCTQCWVPSLQPDVDCISHHLCTKDNYIYKETIDTQYDLFKETACEALQKKNVTGIAFLGDSYIRHIFQGFIITLSGNYHNGATLSKDRKCLDEGQISEKKGCSSMLFEAAMCNGTVSLNLYQKQDVSLKLNELITSYSKKGAIVLYSVGNHPTARHVKRSGVHNATITASILYNNYCNPAVARYNKYVGMKNVYWVSTHTRLFHYFEDETEERILEFNLEMRDYVEKHCPPMGYIDVYNMTDALVTNHYNESLTMTFDRVHWGFNVNLLKTSMILNRILKQ